jgi:AcrR family transcriptional regulator
MLSMPRDGRPARERLRAAALELYREHGFDQTTTAQIARRAGVTERTYFRHFADKREVLFDGEEDLRALLVDAVAAAPTGQSPLQLVVQAFVAVVPLIVANRPEAAQRAEVIAVTPALQERAYAKTASLVDALTEALVVRGHQRATARLTAHVGMAAFQYASNQWTGDSAVDLSDLIAEAADKVATLGTHR